MLLKNGLGSFLQFCQYVSYDILDMLAVVCHYTSMFFCLFEFIVLKFNFVEVLVLYKISNQNVQTIL